MGNNHRAKTMAEALIGDVTWTEGQTTAFDDTIVENAEVKDKR